MIVYVNDTPVRTYYGAKVKSAVMAYFRDNNMPVKTPVKEVRDAYGNLIDMDGSIRANSKSLSKYEKTLVDPSGHRFWFGQLPT